MHKIQKKVIRLIYFTNYDISSATTVKKLEILPLNKLVYNRIGITMYKYFNNLLPPAIIDLYVSNNDVHKYSTRQKHLLYILRIHVTSPILGERISAITLTQQRNKQWLSVEFNRWRSERIHCYF